MWLFVFTQTSQLPFPEFFVQVILSPTMRKVINCFHSLLQTHLSFEVHSNVSICWCNWKFGQVICTQAHVPFLSINGTCKHHTVPRACRQQERFGNKNFTKSVWFAILYLCSFMRLQDQHLIFSSQIAVYAYFHLQI